MSKETKHLDYVASKIHHMVRQGIPAEIGPNGGACPVWMQEERKEEERRRKRRLHRPEHSQ